MPTRFDFAYLAAACALSPLTAWPRFRHKAVDALHSRRGRTPDVPADGLRVLVHGVSVGEVNAARELVRGLLACRDDLHVTVSSTTSTGYARVRDLYADGQRTSAARFPLDLSSCVRRFLGGLRPHAVVLMELEVWPNFVVECGRGKVPVIVANGRMTAGSFRNYRRAGPLLRGTFGRIARVLAQEDVYADRFRRLGAPHVETVGSTKFDSARVGQRVEGDAALADAVGLSPRAWGGVDPVVIAGSTGPGEERIILDAWDRVSAKVPGARLVIVPRKPERFDDVADFLATRGRVLRRSTGRVAGGGEGPPVVLVDSMGELRRVYAAADVVIIGRTLLDLGPKQHGSDLIEPAALGKPVVTGPYWGNFAEPVRVLSAAGAVREVADVAGLSGAVTGWLADPSAADAAGRAGRQAVADNRGASAAAVRVVMSLLAEAGHAETLVESSGTPR